MGQLRHLVHLRLHGKREIMCTLAGQRNIASLRHLTHLDMSGFSLEHPPAGEQFPLLTSSPQMRHLGLHDKVRGTMANLHTLYMDLLSLNIHNKNIGLYGPSGPWTSMHPLTALQMGGEMRQHGGEILQHLPRLKRLVVYRLSAVAVPYLPLHLRELAVLQAWNGVVEA